MNQKTTLKNFYIIIFIIIILLGGVFFVTKKMNKSSSLVKDAYIKNLTWETDISKTVPYTKGNLLEYVYIITPEQASKIIINIKNLYNHLNITNIEINGTPQDTNKTILEAEIKDVTTLKIIGEAIINSNETKEDKNIKNIIDISVKEPITTTNTQIEENNKSELEDKKEEEEEGEDNEKENINTAATNITLNKYNFSSNIDNLIEISGENLDNIAYVNIGGNSYTPLLDNNNLYLNIDAESFDSGEYFLLLQMKNGELIPLEKKVSFIFIDSEINITAITPDSIKNDKSKMIVLQGNGFEKIISLQLSNNTVIQNASFNVISDNVMSVKIPEGLTPGDYHFNIMDISGITEMKNIKFNITK